MCIPADSAEEAAAGTGVSISSFSSVNSSAIFRFLYNMQPSLDGLYRRFIVSGFRLHLSLVCRPGIQGRKHLQCLNLGTEGIRLLGLFGYRVGQLLDFLAEAHCGAPITCPIAAPSHPPRRNRCCTTARATWRCCSFPFRLPASQFMKFGWDTASMMAA